MNIKLITGVVALAVGSSVGIAQGATESRETTIEQSTTVDAPKVIPNRVEETTTTTKTKRGLLGRKKSETTSTTTSERQPDTMTTREYRSKSTVDTERSY